MDWNIAFGMIEKAGVLGAPPTNSNFSKRQEAYHALLNESLNLTSGYGATVHPE